MNKPDTANAARLIPLLVVGMMLNTLGIVLTGIGNFRFVIMAAGLALILTFIIKVLAGRKEGGRPEAP